MACKGLFKEIPRITNLKKNNTRILKYVAILLFAAKCAHSVASVVHPSVTPARCRLRLISRTQTRCNSSAQQPLGSLALRSTRTVCHLSKVESAFWARMGRLQVSSLQLLHFCSISAHSSFCTTVYFSGVVFAKEILLCVLIFDFSIVL